MQNDPFTNAVGQLPGVEELAKKGVKITGLPADHQGVEMKAAARLNPDLGPMPTTMVNGGLQFASKPAAAAAPSITGAQLMAYGNKPAPAGAVAPRSAAPAIKGDVLRNYGNPLGGMSSAPLSGRGGPMSYSRQGEGTNNPNAFAVGEGSRRPTRALETLARRGSEPAAIALAEYGTRAIEGAANRGAAAQAADLSFARTLQTYGMNRENAAADDAREFDQALQMFGLETQRRAGESEVEFQRRQAAESAETQGRSVTGVEMLNTPDNSGFVAAVRRQNGNLDMASGYIPTPAQTDDSDTIAARLQDYGKTNPNATVTAKLPNGVTIKQNPAKPTAPAKPETVKVLNDQGRLVDFPAGYVLPQGWTALSKSADGTNTPASKSSRFTNFLTDK